jgi:hypothetical protein
MMTRWYDTSRVQNSSNNQAMMYSTPCWYAEPTYPHGRHVSLVTHDPPQRLGSRVYISNRLATRKEILRWDHRLMNRLRSNPCNRGTEKPLHSWACTSIKWWSYVGNTSPSALHPSTVFVSVVAPSSQFGNGSHQLPRAFCIGEHRLASNRVDDLWHHLSILLSSTGQIPGAKASHYHALVWALLWYHPARAIYLQVARTTWEIR